MLTILHRGTRTLLLIVHQVVRESWRLYQHTVAVSLSAKTRTENCSFSKFISQFSFTTSQASVGDEDMF
jgi:hypothetical protein